MLPLGGSVGCWVIQVVNDYFHPTARLVFFSLQLFSTPSNTALCLLYRFLSLLSPHIFGNYHEEVAGKEEPAAGQIPLWDKNLILLK